MWNNEKYNLTISDTELFASNPYVCKIEGKILESRQSRDGPFDMNGSQNGKCNHVQRKTIQDETGYNLSIVLSFRSVACEDDGSFIHEHLKNLQDVSYLRAIIAPTTSNYIVRYGDDVDRYPEVPQCTPQIIKEAYTPYVIPGVGGCGSCLIEGAPPPKPFTEELVHSPSILGTLLFVVIVLFG